jgi:hypothetical protein
MQINGDGVTDTWTFVNTFKLTVTMQIVQRASMCPARWAERGPW